MATKLVRKPSQKSLKSQGAGYSTTDRKTGTTTYYKSSKDAPGYNDTTQSRSNQSKGTPMSAIDKTGKAISVNQLGTTSPVIPPAPTPKDVGNMLGMGNASVLPEGYNIEGGQFVYDPKASETTNAYNENSIGLGNVANQMLSYLKPEDNQAANLYRDTYGISDKEAGKDLRRSEQEKNKYVAQLNQITAERDAAALSLEGQGRGQTSGFVGGEQARINREAAIQALPVQAQFAAAQADYETAKAHVDTLFSMKIKDIETQQAYKQVVANTWMSVANAQQQNKLNAAIADSNARAEEKKANLQMANQLSQQAFDNGQSALAAKIMKLDQTSPTFQEDLANLQGQVVNTNALLQQEAQRASIAASRASTAKNQAELASIQAKEKQIADAIASGNIPLDSEQQKTAMSLGKQFEDESKNFKVQVNAYNQILASAEEPSAAGDLSLLFGYMKMLDPNSVVRETEFANAENAAGVPERIRAQWNKVQSGERLSESMRADFIDRADKLYSSALDQQIDLEDTYRQQGTDVYNLPDKATDLIIRDIRASGSVSDVAFAVTLNKLSNEQLMDLKQSGLLTTPSGI